jgi:putative spermidine/putrescine transport system permease protein
VLFVTGIAVTFLQSFGLFAPGAQGTGPLAAYRAVLTEPGFLRSFRFSLWVAFSSAVSAVVLGILLALGLWRLSAGLRRVAVIYKLPLILPHISVAFIMLIIFSQSGIAASIAHNLGLIENPAGFPDLFYNGSGAGLILSYVWKETPFAALMVISVLHTLDPRYLETARMLGGGPWRRLRRVILPHIAPAVHTTFIILFLYSFGAFDIPYLAGESSPQMLSVRVFNLYFRRELALRPQAMAMLALMLLFALLFILIYLRVAGRLSPQARKL